MNHLDREKAFIPRRNTGYEIWFGTVLDASGRAFWFRYSVLYRKRKSPVSALWAAFFDTGAQEHACYQAVPCIYADPGNSSRYIVQSDISHAFLSWPGGNRLTTSRAAVEFQSMDPQNDSLNYLDP